MEKKARKIVLMIFMLSVILRAVVLFVAVPYYPNFVDDGQLKKTGEYILEGKNPYLQDYKEFSRTRFDHMPGWMIYSSIITLLSDILKVSWHILYRIFFLIMDVLMNLLILNIIRRKQNEKNAIWAFFVYAINPVTIIASVFLAHPTMVIMYFVVLAWNIYDESKGNKWIESAFIFSLSLTWQLLTIIMIPAIFASIKKWKNKFLYAAVIGIMPALIILPFLASNIQTAFHIVTQLFSYFGSGYSWGLYFLFEPLNKHVLLTKLLTIVCLAVIYIIIYKVNATLITGIYLSLLTFIVLRNLMGMHHFSWIIPFVFLIESRTKILLVVAASTLSMVAGILYWGAKGGFTQVISESTSLAIMNLFFIITWAVLMFLLIHKVVQIISEYNIKKYLNKA